jgi:hypothetical protein
MCKAPQGLKPTIIPFFSATAEAVPFPILHDPTLNRGPEAPDTAGETPALQHSGVSQEPVKP